MLIEYIPMSTNYITNVNRQFLECQNNTIMSTRMYTPCQQLEHSISKNYITNVNKLHKQTIFSSNMTFAITSNLFE